MLGSRRRCVRLALSSLCASALALPARPPPVPPSVGAVISGVYRDMFAEAGYAQADIDAKIAAAYSQLYLDGDAATQRIAFAVPGNMSYVTDAKNKDVRTEGMSYGMMVQVQMNNQTMFDQLWRWVLRYMYHAEPTDPLHGWSAWHATVEGVPIDEGPAPDGETFFCHGAVLCGRALGQRRRVQLHCVGGHDPRPRHGQAGSGADVRAGEPHRALRPGHRLFRPIVHDSCVLRRVGAGVGGHARRVARRRRRRARPARQGDQREQRPRAQPV